MAPNPDASLVPLTANGDGTWGLEVTDAVANPMGVLYGGAPLAASVQLAEETFGAPTRWATTRFLHGAAIGDHLTVDVRADVQGHRTSHVTVTGRSVEHVVFETMLGVGMGRPEAMRRQFLEMPDAPDPDTLETPPMIDHLAKTAIGRIERRLAYGTAPFSGDIQPDGRIGIWMRVTGQPSGARPTLAWLADCMPLSIAVATGQMPVGASLDNTIRFGSSTDTEWALVDIRAESVDNGYAYGTVHLWASDGTLMATGTQTAVIRTMSPPM